jgi:UDP-N-acetylglucosamine:LPS N-acetylglucosamine transferase
MNTIHKKNIEELADQFESPILVLSTVVGKGIVSVGDAVTERLRQRYTVHHAAIEDFLPPAALNEDMERYKLISNHVPFLLTIVYRFPFIYYRKYVREKLSKKIKLIKLKEKIDELGIKTVICCSHRPAFWTSSLKRKTRMPFKIWGLLSEFGRNLGWKYIYWDQMSGYLSPVPQETFDYRFPPDFRFFEINLPVKNEYLVLNSVRGDCRKVLLVCGFWGQGPIAQIVSMLRKSFPELEILTVCGENERVLKTLNRKFSLDKKVRIFGAVSSLAPLLSECASLITKPGISTILEGGASGRKMFLLKGMPVAEDNNLRYAIKNFGAEWFSLETFRKWYQAETKNNR